MSDIETADDEVVWRRLAMRLSGELPTDHQTALRVLAYMAELLHHTDEVRAPITVETDSIILQFNRKKKG